MGFMIGCFRLSFPFGRNVVSLILIIDTSMTAAGRFAKYKLDHSGKWSQVLFNSILAHDDSLWHHGCKQFVHGKVPQRRLNRFGLSQSFFADRTWCLQWSHLYAQFLLGKNLVAFLFPFQFRFRQTKNIATLSFWMPITIFFGSRPSLEWKTAKYRNGGFHSHGLCTNWRLLEHSAIHMPALCHCMWNAICRLAPQSSPLGWLSRAHWPVRLNTSVYRSAVKRHQAWFMQVSMSGSIAESHSGISPSFKLDSVLGLTMDYSQICSFGDLTQAPSALLCHFFVFNPDESMFNDTRYPLMKSIQSLELFWDGKEFAAQSDMSLAAFVQLMHICCISFGTISNLSFRFNHLWDLLSTEKTNLNYLTVGKWFYDQVRGTHQEENADLSEQTSWEWDIITAVFQIGSPSTIDIKVKRSMENDVIVGFIVGAVSTRNISEKGWGHGIIDRHKHDHSFCWPRP